MNFSNIENPIVTATRDFEQRLKKGTDNGSQLLALLQLIETVARWLALLSIDWQSMRDLNETTRSELVRALESGSLGSWQRICKLGKELNSRNSTTTEQSVSDVSLRKELLDQASAFARFLEVPLKGDHEFKQKNIMNARNLVFHGILAHPQSNAAYNEILEGLRTFLEPGRVQFGTLTLAEHESNGTGATASIQLHHNDESLEVFPSVLCLESETESEVTELAILSKVHPGAADYHIVGRIGIRRISKNERSDLFVDFDTLRGGSDRHLAPLRSINLIGRQDALDTAIERLQTALPGTVFLIEAEPGAGKSAFMAGLATEIERHAGLSLVGASYYSTRDPMRRTHVQILTELASGLGLISPKENLTLRDALIQTLEEFVKAVSKVTAVEHQHRVQVLLIDGLDEEESFLTLSHPLKNVDFLGSLKRAAELSSTVIVVSSRPGPRESSQTRCPDLLAQEGSQNGLRRLTVQQSIEVLDSLLGDQTAKITDAPEVLQTIAERSQGLPLYLALAAADLRRTPNSERVRSLPISVEEYLGSLIQRSTTTSDAAAVSIALAMLLVAKGGLTFDHFHAAISRNAPYLFPTGDESASTKVVRSALSALSPLTVTLADGSLALFHQSVKDYLAHPSSLSSPNLPTRSELLVETDSNGSSTDYAQLGRVFIDQLAEWMTSDLPALKHYALEFWAEHLVDRIVEATRVDAAGDDYLLLRETLVRNLTDDKIALLQAEIGPRTVSRNLEIITRVLSELRESFPAETLVELVLVRARRAARFQSTISPLLLLEDALKSSERSDKPSELAMLAPEEFLPMHFTAMLLRCLESPHANINRYDLVRMIGLASASPLWAHHVAIMKLAIVQHRPDFEYVSSIMPSLREVVALVNEYPESGTFVGHIFDSDKLREYLLNDSWRQSTTKDRDHAARVLLPWISSMATRSALASFLDDPASDPSSMNDRELALRSVGNANDRYKQEIEKRLGNTNADSVRSIIKALFELGETLTVEIAMRDENNMRRLRKTVVEAARSTELFWRHLIKRQRICSAIEFVSLGPRNPTVKSSPKQSTPRPLGGRDVKCLGAAIRAGQSGKAIERFFSEAVLSDKKSDLTRIAEGLVLIGATKVGEEYPGTLRSLERMRAFAKKLEYPRNRREIVERMAELHGLVGEHEQARTEFLSAIELARDSRLEHEVSMFTTSPLVIQASVDPTGLPATIDAIAKPRAGTAVLYERVRAYVKSSLAEQGAEIPNIESARIKKRDLDKEAISREADVICSPQTTQAAVADECLSQVLVKYQYAYNVDLDLRLVQVATARSFREAMRMIDTLAPGGEGQRAITEIIARCKTPNLSLIKVDSKDVNWYRSHWALYYLSESSRPAPQSLWSDAFSDVVYPPLYRYELDGALVLAQRGEEFFSRSDLELNVLGRGLIATQLLLYAGYIAGGRHSRAAERAISELGITIKGNDVHFTSPFRGHASLMLSGVSQLTLERIDWQHKIMAGQNQAKHVTPPSMPALNQLFPPMDSKNEPDLSGTQIAIFAMLSGSGRFVEEYAGSISDSRGATTLAILLAMASSVLPSQRRDGEYQKVESSIEELIGRLSGDDRVVLELGLLYFATGTSHYSRRASRSVSLMRQMGLAAIEYGSDSLDSLLELSALASTRLDFAYSFSEMAIRVDSSLSHVIARQLVRCPVPSGGTFGLH